MTLIGLHLGESVHIQFLAKKNKKNLLSYLILYSSISVTIAYPGDVNAMVQFAL